MDIEAETSGHAKDDTEGGGTDSARVGKPTERVGDRPKRYTPSRFNAHTIAADGVLILFNSLTGHRCAIPAGSVTSVHRYLSRRGVEGPLNDLGQYLLTKGYIVEEGTDEQAKAEVRYASFQFRTDVLQLILMPTEDCNFRCTYCYETFRPGSMAPAVREGIRNLVRSCAGHLNQLGIGWFGGEPLLAFDVIEDLAPFFHEVAQSHHLTYRADITTNGFLLTPEKFRRMLKWGIRDYYITVDGLGRDHDAHRPLKGGGGTFSQIIANLCSMRDFGEAFNVRVRMNVDTTNVGSVRPLLEYLRTTLLCDKRFSTMFRPVSRWGGPNDDRLEETRIREGSGRVLVECTTQARGSGFHSESLACGWLDPEVGPCYAARPYCFTIGPDGKVMKCTLLLEKDDRNIVGRISQDGRLNIVEERFAKWVRPYVLTDPLCSKCFFAPTCQGVSCPLSRVLGEGRKCPPHRLRMHETLNLASKDDLSALGGHRRRFQVTGDN